jgi:Uncharacterized protein conserved in bacteria
MIFSRKKIAGLDLTRRRYLAGSSAWLVSLPFTASHSFANANTGVHKKIGFDDCWVSAQGDSPATYGTAWLNSRDQMIQIANSGFRGHDCVALANKDNHVLMIARRPGRTATELNILSGAQSAQFSCPENRQFEGHACCSGDGRMLYTTETDRYSGEGYIGVYRSSDYHRIGEYPSGGIGPHQLKLMPDLTTLVVANGGMRGKANSETWLPTNLDSMQSSLAYLNAATGELLEQRFLTEEKASIRHLDVTAEGVVVVGLQVQRSAMTSDKIVALGAVHRRDSELKLLTAPDILWQNMRDYVGSVAVNNQFNRLVLTSPRGNVAAFWEIESGELAGYLSLHDVCGAAMTADQSECVLSNSSGALRFINMANLQEQRAKRLEFEQLRWDNHLVNVSAR